jgi:spore coat polysaccharide biosynthesis predicted glycosyltransferase SpsG
MIAALDWGLGHATRCVPIVRELEKNNHIIIGITSLTKSIFEEEFPHLQKINLPEYNIRYSAFLPVWFKILLDWPRINKVIKSENQLLKKIIEINRIDCVISDNRFGLYSKSTHSVFITHQLFLKTPFLNSLAQYINKKLILNFNEVWIPDYEDENKSLSGELSHGKHFHHNVKYIGPKSRLEKFDSLVKNYDVLFLLSGPEPQQSILGRRLVAQVTEKPDLKFALVSNSFITESKSNLEVFKSPNNQNLSKLIAQSKKIVCSCGYSTLMDMHYLEKKSLFLMPTKGQTEQEYLASFWNEKYKSYTIQKNNIDSVFTNPISVD